MRAGDANRQSSHPIERSSDDLDALLAAGKVIIFTDGAAQGNPGPGGYGAILRFRDQRKELSGGFRRTTNNRMELLACIVALRALKRSLEVVVYSDSQYLVRGINEGWARRWRSRGWLRTKSEIAENVDLWSELLELCERHRVEFRWVRGHAGHPDNEHCDELAASAATGAALPADVPYETGRTQEPRATLLDPADSIQD